MKCDCRYTLFMTHTHTLLKVLLSCTPTVLYISYTLYCVRSDIFILPLCLHTQLSCDTILIHTYAPLSSAFISTTICPCGISYNSAVQLSLSYINTLIRTQHTQCVVVIYYSLYHCCSATDSADTHTYTHTLQVVTLFTRSSIYNCYSLEHTTRSFPSRNIAFGSCICFEEQFLSCDSLRPIRTF